MKKLFAIALLFCCFAGASKKPEQWITPERRAALNVIVTRPVIIKKEHTQDGRKILGKPSKDARRDNLEAVKAERDTVKAERDTLKVENDNLKKQKKGPTQ
jgi:hypothetical protein